MTYLRSSAQHGTQDTVSTPGKIHGHQLEKELVLHFCAEGGPPCSEAGEGGWTDLHFSSITRVLLLATGGVDPRGKAVRKFCLVQTQWWGLDQGSAGEGERRRWILGKSGRGLRGLSDRGTSVWGERGEGEADRRFCLG